MERETILLRREDFGGILASTRTGQYTPLDRAAYEAMRKELSHRRGDQAEVRLFDPTERGYPLLPDAVSAPLSLYLELTKNCNAACRHCFVACDSSRTSRSEMSLAEIRALVTAFAQVGGFNVRLTGGEPTTRKDLLAIIDSVRAEGLRLGLNTNGLLDRPVLDGLLSHGVRDIRLSLDGPEPVNDAIRGRGSFARAVATLNRIVEFNRTAAEPVQLTINVVLMRSNLPVLEDMIAMARECQSQISFGLLRLSGRAGKEEMLAPAEVASAAQRVQKTREKLGLPAGAVRINYDVFGKGVRLEHRPCPFDNSRCPMGIGLAIDAFGRVAPCGYMVNTQAWLGEDSRGKDLLDLWHHASVLVRARQVTRRGCQGCRFYLSRCNGGCPYMAYQFGGDSNGRDPYCIREVSLPAEEEMR
jgi:radical SAM protein with 4Fe4S-binding SPASM domain